MAEFTAQSFMSLFWSYTDDDAAGRDGLDANTLPQIVTLTKGTGAGQCDQVYQRRHTIAEDATLSLNLTTGLHDKLGRSLSYARMKILALKAVWGDSEAIRADLAVAASPLAAWFGDPGFMLPVVAGGGLQFVAPGAIALPVTAGLTDAIELTAVGGDAIVDVVIIGASA